MAQLELYDEAAGDNEASAVASDHPLPVRLVADPGTGLAPTPFAAGQQPGYFGTNMTTQTTTVIKTGGGILHAIVFNKPLAAGVVTIYDGLSASGVLKGTITFPATLLTDVGTYLYDMLFQAGLTIVTSGATQDITICWV